MDGFREACSYIIMNDEKIFDLYHNDINSSGIQICHILKSYLNFAEESQYNKIYDYLDKIKFKNFILKFNLK